MKNKNILLALSLLLMALSSCKKENCDVLIDNVVGEWSVSNSEVIFESNGVLLDPSNKITDFGSSKTWKVLDETIVITTVGGNEVLLETLDVLRSECNRITLEDIHNQTFALRRR